jgi:hypothetical protein
MREQANDYAMDVLNKLDNVLDKLAQGVEGAKAQIQKAS